MESSEQAGAELALHFRLYNYSVKSGAPEDKIKSFIAKVSSGDFSPEKVIELANQIYEISKAESVSPLNYKAISSKNWNKRKRLMNKFKKLMIYLKVRMWLLNLSMNTSS